MVQVVTDDGECRAVDNFAQVEQQLLEQENFLVCNRGVIVNMDKVLRFDDDCIEMLDGKPYPSTIGEITVTKLSGDDFAECSVPKKIGAELLARFQAAEKLTCNLIIK